MPSLDPKAGNRYLTIAGAPVQVLEIHGGIMVLQSLASDNRLCVPAAYPLQPFDRGKAVWEMRTAPYNARFKKVKSRVAQNKPLAPIIDAMLLAGNMTMRGILRELRRRASTECRGRDLEANVRARLYWMKQKGFRVETGNGRLRVLRS